MASRRIPLFPLNTVLFPGMLLPLHVFEPRYQEMVRACLEADRLFGVCLIRAGQEVGGPADPCVVGTTCEILKATPVGGGRMDLTTVGRDRFAIRRLITDHAYLEAEIDLIPERPCRCCSRELLDRVCEATKEYVRLLMTLAGQPRRELELPEDPVALSYLLGAILEAPLPVRQELLEARETSDRLARQLKLLEEVLRDQSLRNQACAARPFRLRDEHLTLN